MLESLEAYKDSRAAKGVDKAARKLEKKTVGRKGRGGSEGETPLRAAMAEKICLPQGWHRPLTGIMIKKYAAFLTSQGSGKAPTKKSDLLCFFFSYFVRGLSLLYFLSTLHYLQIDGGGGALGVCRGRLSQRDAFGYNFI